MIHHTIKLLLLLLLSSGISYAQDLEPEMPDESEAGLLLPEVIALPGVNIEQAGMNNEVFVQQIGAVPRRDQQYATLVQSGHYNALDLTQQGNGNQVTVQQVGDGNEYDGMLQGNDNRLDVGQFGNDNRLVQELVGNQNTYEVLQEGNNNELIQREYGNGLEYQVHQQGSMQVIIENGFWPIDNFISTCWG